MSLEIQVMPLWKSKLDEIGKVVCSNSAVKLVVVGDEDDRPPSRLACWRAKRRVRRVVKEAKRALGMPLTWRDEGEEVYGEQASCGFEALRAYAKWLDLQDVFPTFEEPLEANFYKHPVFAWSGEERPFRFSHLIDHSCYYGYFVPCRFDRVVYIEPRKLFGRFPIQNSFGSSYTLAEQLAELEPHVPAMRDPAMHEPACTLIRNGFDLLKEASEKSIEHGLPIVFYG